MNLSHRHGHTKASPGAISKLNELDEATLIDKRVADLLRSVGNTMNNCNPPSNYQYPSELQYGINKCNQSNSNLFYSIHLNSFKGAKGSEVCVYPNTPICNVIGGRILKNLENLGFVNRGLKPRTDLGELTDISCPSMIIETCFLQEPDASLYKKIGVEKIARAIANGIDPKVKLENENKPSITKPYTEYRNVIVYNNNANADKSIADYFTMVLNDANENCISVDYNTYKKGTIKGISTFAVGGSLKGKFKYDKIFGGKDRNDTAQLVLDHLKKY